MMNTQRRAICWTPLWNENRAGVGLEHLLLADRAADSVVLAFAAGGDLRVYVPLRLSTPLGMLNLISTTMVFGTPLDVTLSELAIETFFPADEEAMSILSRVVRA